MSDYDSLTNIYIANYLLTYLLTDVTFFRVYQMVIQVVQ